MTAVLDDDLGWLLGTPVSDLNFTVALHRADVEVLEQARRDLDGQDGVKTKLAQLDRELEFRRMLTHDPTEQLEAIRDRLAAKPGNVEHLAKLHAELDRRHQVAATGNAGAEASAPGLLRAGRPGLSDNPMVDGWAMLDVEEIVPAPDNPRRHLGDLDELAASIEAHGILEPLLVTSTVPPTDRWLLVCGARRLAAAKQAGLQKVPAVIRELTEAERVATMLVENVQRSNLTALEEASAFARLLEVDPDATQRDLARLTGVSQRTISTRLSLLELPIEALEALDTGRITLGAAERLHKLVDAGRPDRAAELAVQEAAGELQGWRSLDHLVGEDLEQLEADRKAAAARADLEAKGVTVLTQPKGGWHNKAPRPLTGQDRAEDGHGWCISYQDLDVALGDHQALSCHAAAVCEHGEVVWMCRDPKQHPPAVDDAEAKRRARFEREEAKRKATEKELAQAGKAREAFLVELLAAAGVDDEFVWPEAHLELLADVTTVAIERLESEAAKLACKLLALTPVEIKGFHNTTKDWKLTLHQAAEQDLARVARVVFLAEGEFRLRWTWGTWRGRLEARYAAALKAAGYTFGKAEAAKLNKAQEGEASE